MNEELLSKSFEAQADAILDKGYELARNLDSVEFDMMSLIQDVVLFLTLANNRFRALNAIRGDLCDLPLIGDSLNNQLKQLLDADEELELTQEYEPRVKEKAILYAVASEFLTANDWKVKEEFSPLTIVETILKKSVDIVRSGLDDLRDLCATIQLLDLNRLKGANRE